MTQTPSEDFSKKAVEITIKLALIGFLFSWCYFIIQPFISLILWALIITVALYPVFNRLVILLNGRYKLVAISITLILLLIIVGPGIFLTNIIVMNVEELSHKLSAGSLTVPLPSENVATWPLVGSTVFKYWTQLSTNMIDTIKQLAPQLQTAGKWLFTNSFSATLDILKFILAIIISGILLANGQGAHRVALVIAKRFVGEKGEEFVLLTVATIRSVAIGVLGVALIQSLCAGAGLIVVEIPGAGILTLLCFFLSVIQVGPTIILIPAIIYVFSVHETTTGLIFTAWCVFVMLMDNVLKPILLGRGNTTPTVIIFIGAIGGLMFSGIIGLFVGAVVLALAYELFRNWVFENE